MKERTILLKFKELEDVNNLDLANIEHLPDTIIITARWAGPIAAMITGLLDRDTVHDGGQEPPR